MDTILTTHCSDITVPIIGATKLPGTVSEQTSTIGHDVQHIFNNILGPGIPWSVGIPGPFVGNVQPGLSNTPMDVDYCGPPPLVSITSIVVPSAIYGCAHTNKIQRRRVLTLPTSLQYNMVYHVKRDDGGTAVIDSYVSSGLPCHGDGLTLTSADASQSTGNGSTLIKPPVELVRLNTSPADDNTKGQCVEVPFDMSGISGFTLRVGRAILGEWTNDTHSDSEFTVTLSPAAVGANTFDTSAGGYNKPMTMDAMTLSFGRTIDVSIRKHDGTSTLSIIPIVTLTSMGIYDGSAIDILLYEDGGNMLCRVYHHRQQHAFIVNVPSAVPWFDTGSIIFHHHNLGGSSSEIIQPLGIAVGNIQPVLKRATPSVLPTLV